MTNEQAQAVYEWLDDQIANGRVVAGYHVMLKQSLERVLRTFDGVCKECAGTGERDSGGTHPWGAPVNLACDHGPEQQPELSPGHAHDGGQFGSANLKDDGSVHFARMYDVKRRFKPGRYLLYALPVDAKSEVMHKLADVSTVSAIELLNAPNQPRVRWTLQFDSKYGTTENMRGSTLRDSLITAFNWALPKHEAPDESKPVAAALEIARDMHTVGALDDEQLEAYTALEEPQPAAYMFHVRQTKPSVRSVEFAALDYDPQTGEKLLSKKPLFDLHTIAHALHYPEHWDTATYPNIVMALREVYSSFRCEHERDARAKPDVIACSSCGLTLNDSKALANFESVREYLDEAVACLGPTAPACCGCDYEWNLALRAIKSARALMKSEDQ